MPEFCLYFQLGNFYYFENYILFDTPSVVVLPRHMKWSYLTLLVLRILFSTGDLAVPIFIALPAI